MTNKEQEAETQEEPDVEIDLATPDMVAYDELVDAFGEELILADVQEVVKERVRSLYDNQDEIKQRIAQAQQR